MEGRSCDSRPTFCFFAPLPRFAAGWLSVWLNELPHGSRKLGKNRDKPALASLSNRGDSKPQSPAVAPHTKKRRSVKIAIRGRKARRASRRSFQFMRTGQKCEVDRETPSDKKERPPVSGAASSQRGNDASPMLRQRGHDRFIGTGGLVIPGQLLVLCATSLALSFFLLFERFQKSRPCCGHD